jgi:hypothetical protein
MGLARLGRRGHAAWPKQDVGLWPQKPDSNGGWIAQAAQFQHSAFAGFQFVEAQEAFWSHWGLATFLGLAALAFAIIVGVAYAVRKHREGLAKETKDVSPQQIEGQDSVSQDQKSKVPEARKSEIPVASEGVSAKEASEGVSAKEDIIALVGLARRVGTFVGPKLAKGQAIQKLISNRISGVRGKAENMLMQEANGIAAEMCEIIDAPEMMLLKDWDAGIHSAASSFPPLPALLSGLIAPLRLQSSLWSNLVHILGILPVVGMCGWGLYTDWNHPCKPIPAFRYWVISTLCVGVVLLLARVMLYFSTRKGLQSLENKANEAHIRSEARLQDMELGEESKLRGMKELLIDHCALASHALKVDASINASIWNRVIGVTTVLYVCCIYWNLWEVIVWTFVPGTVAFHEAAKGDPHYCGSWHIVLVGRIVAILAGVLLIPNIFTILAFVMQSDYVASKINAGTQKFDKNTIGLPVSQLFVRLSLMPTAELENVQLQSMRQESMTIEQDLHHMEKNMEQLKKKRDQKNAKLKELEAKAVERAESGRSKDPLDQTFEEVEQAVRDSFNPDLWHSQGLDAIRKAKESGSDPQQGPPPQSESLERLVTDISSFATEKFQQASQSQEFQKASQLAQSAAQYGTEQVQGAIVQAQQLDPEQLRLASTKALEQVAEKGKVAMAQAQQSDAFQKASSASASAMQQMQQSEALKQVAEKGKVAMEQAKQSEAFQKAKIVAKQPE